jgi:hypothetical protein
MAEPEQVPGNSGGQPQEERSGRAPHPSLRRPGLSWKT